jgi:nucleotide-binding universal stress UspA family protein
MNAESKQPSHIVLVVGVDMSDINEHLLAQAGMLIRPVDDAEVHVVHVVHPDPFAQRIARPLHSSDVGASSHVESAKWELQRLCDSLFQRPRTRVFVHTPIGDTAEELTQIARDVSADLLVTEAHEHSASGVRRIFHRSVLARIARTAPCTVLTIRRPVRQANRGAAQRSDSSAGATVSSATS